MKEEKIGIFDSGSGGFTVLEELKKVLPYETFLYYKDTLNIPYGSKSDKELYNIVQNIVKFLIKNNCKLIVIACNTATTKCIKKLRRKFPNMIFVGTEPAIKMACDNKCLNTLVMATPATIKSKSVKKLIRKYKNKKQTITLLSCEGLAKTIEDGNDNEVNKILKDIVGKYLNENIDSVVLGCTHYPLIKDKISKIFNNAIIYDGSKGVASEVKYLLEINNMCNKENSKQNIIIVDSEIKNN